MLHRSADETADGLRRTGIKIQALLYGHDGVRLYSWYDCTLYYTVL
jgi:hypothetical protein